MVQNLKDKTLSSIMDVGDVVTTTLMANASHYLTNGNIQIDGRPVI